MIDTQIRDRIAQDLSALKSSLPQRTKLLCERIIYPDEIPIFATAFVLISSVPDETGRLPSLLPPLELTLREEENERTIFRLVERWLKRFPEETSLDFLPKSFSKTGAAYLPDDVSDDWKLFVPPGEKYTFGEVFTD